MTPLNVRRAILPEIDPPEWAVTAAARRLVDVEYVGKMEAVVFRFEDGRIFGVPLQELEGVDGTPVTRAILVYDGDAVVIEQFSGNRLEVPWDVVLCHADPSSRTGIKVAHALGVSVAALVAQRPGAGTVE